MTIPIGQQFYAKPPSPCSSFSRRVLAGLFLWSLATLTSFGGVVISGGGLALVEEGGGFAEGNMATNGTAFAKDTIGAGPHTIAGVNDGLYGNSSSWIGGTANSFVGIRFGAIPMPLYKVAFGRDNLSNFTDRVFGLYTLQYTTVADPDESTPDAAWNTIGTLDYQSAGGTNFANPILRHAFTFREVLATGFRIKTDSATDHIAIDEIELYRPGITVSGGVRLAAEGGSFHSNNLAASGVAFAKDELGSPPHSIGAVNDGAYGNTNSWIAGSTNSWIGISLGTSPVTVARIAFGRDNTGIFADRVFATYTLQVTTVADPDETTPDAAWTTIGAMQYTRPGGMLFNAPALRHEFAFAPVPATGIRLRIDGAADIDNIVAIDELEVYGPPLLRLEHPPGRTHAMKTKVSVWGEDGAGQTTVPTNTVGAVSVVAAPGRIAVLTPTRSFTGWGSTYPTLNTDPAGRSGLRQIASGWFHNLLLTSNGSIAAWAHTNAFGEGDVPPAFTNGNVQAVAAGFRYSVALTGAGSVVAWGDNSAGQTNVPPGLTNVQAIAAGYAHVVALANDGTVTAWGLNDAGQTNVPPGLRGVKAIAAGDHHTLALTTNGTVVAWGGNAHGQSTVPPGLFGVQAISAGSLHSVALLDDGRLVFWGTNALGQMTVPDRINLVRTVSAASQVTAAIYSEHVPMAFGPVPSGSVTSKLFTVYNDGTGPLAITHIDLRDFDAEVFALDTGATATVIQPGGSTTLTVTFAPTNTAAVESTLYLETDDPDRPVFAFAVNGNQPDPIPPLITTPGNLAVPTTNLSGTVVTYDVLVEDNADLDPQVTITPPSGSLFPLGMTTVVVRAVDFSGNTSTASFVVNVTLPTPVLIETGGSFATNNLASGATAFAQDQAFFPTHSIAAVNDGVYGNASSWIGVSPANFIGINLGATPVAVEQIAFGRDNNGNFGDRVQGVYTVQFTTTPNPDAATPASAWTSFGSIVYPGASPLPARRNRYAFQRVEATGIRLLTQTDSLPVAIDEIELYDYNPIPFIVIEQPAGNALVSGVSTINFGTREAGTSGPTNTYTVRNAGGVLLNITNIATIGSNATDFIVTPASGWPSLPTNSSTTFHVVFQPSGVGPRSATLRVQNSSSNEPVFDIHLTGISADTTPPVINIPSNQFVYITEGTGSVATFTLPSATDNSSLPPTVSTEPESGSFFPLGTNTVTITATDSVNNSATGTFAIIVRPRARIAVEAPAGSALTGAPPSYAFGSLLVGATTSQTFALVNDGLAALAISGASVIGAHPAEFVLETSGLSPSIGIGGTSHFAVTFAPLAHGARTATVRLVTDDPVTPFLDVHLAGDGLDITPPVITPPAAFSVVAGSPTGGVRVFYPPIAVTDDAISAVDVVVDPANASLLPPGTNLVTVTATDPGSNTSTATFEVVVVPAVYPPEIPVGGSVPFNLALGRTAFAKDFLGAPHLIPTLNDGVYGNANGWIGNSPNSFVGINLGATPVEVNRVAFGRDHKGSFIDRTIGTYTLQYTTTANPDAATLDWHTIGAVTYTADFTNRARRNVYAFPPVMATGIRLLTAAGEFPLGIDELEIHGLPGAMSLEQPAGAALTSGISVVTFDPRDLATASAPKTFTLRNPGPGAMRITRVAVTNDQVGEFILAPTNLFTTLAAGATTTFQVVFQPVALGPRQTTLRVTADNTQLAVMEVALAGTGVDVSGPVIVPPANIIRYIADTETNVVVTYPPAVATDNSGLAPVVTYSHPSGSAFPVGSNVVTITAVDASSNTSTATFVVDVRYSPTLTPEIPEGSPFVLDNTVQVWGALPGGVAPPANLSNATAVSIGNQHGLILLGDGTVTAWGNDEFGQSTVPGGLSNVVAISAGSWHSLALKADGTVAGWGTHDTSLPVAPPITIPPGLTGVVQVSGGFYMSAARFTDGTITVWGENDAGQLDVPPGLTNVVDISCASEHCLALLANGTVVAWGDNSEGKATVPSGLSNAVQVSAGASFSVALRSDGSALSWGQNSGNAFGALTVATNLVEVRAGAAHISARRADGTIVVYGPAESPQVTGAAAVEDALSLGSWMLDSVAAVVKDWPSLDFGAVPVGERVTNTVVVRNTGLGSLSLTNLVLVGADAGQFQVDASAGAMPVASGDATMLSIIFTPAGPAGARAATLRLFSNDQQVPLWKLRLSAQATDDEPPVFTSTNAIIAYASETGGVRVLIRPPATDNSGVPPSVIATPLSGSLFPLGTNPVTVVATDESGNAATSSLQVIVRFTDTLPAVGPSDPVPPNLARNQPAFALNVTFFLPHSIPALNDGMYGNDSSWIGLTPNSFAGINLGATPVLLDRIAFGRDNTGIQLTRAQGTYTVQVTTVPNPDTSTPDSAWQTIGVIENPGQVDHPSRRNLIAFAPVHATGVRLNVASASAEIAIDEIELYGPPAPFAAWRAAHFTPGEQLDGAISGPLADPGQSGVANLYRYATGLDREDDPKPALPRLQGLQFIYRRLLDPESGVDYFVEISTNLPNAAAWREIESADGITEASATPNPDGITEDVRMSIPPGTVNPILNLRLKVSQEE